MNGKQQGIAHVETTQLTIETELVDNDVRFYVGGQPKGPADVVEVTPSQSALSVTVAFAPRPGIRYQNVLLTGPTSVAAAGSGTVSATLQVADVTYETYDSAIGQTGSGSSEGPKIKIKPPQ